MSSGFGSSRPHRPLPILQEKDVARFESKLMLAPGGCLEWTGPKNARGYGRFDLFLDGKRVKATAHRLAYFLATGVDPGPWLVRHTCDNPACCEPQHLLLGTQTDNMADARARGRWPGRRVYRRGAAALRPHTENVTLEPLQRRRCNGCREVKAFDEFNRRASAVSGRAGTCRECAKAQHEDYRARKRREMANPS